MALRVLRGAGARGAAGGGRERVLLEHFFHHDTGSDEAITDEDVDEYLRSYGRPDRLANGFAYYRSVEADTEVISRLGGTPLPMPALAVGCGLAGGRRRWRAWRGWRRRCGAKWSPTAATSSPRSVRGNWPGICWTSWPRWTPGAELQAGTPRAEPGHHLEFRTYRLRRRA
ncbi:hypothetical protein NKH77_54040 [Streptomyces sp. M19]